ncbi:hypothetical protein GGF47_002538 [Coemansia sp. RSA 2524]|nr:hypothetical protein GGF47_002538 [Coemansia sp. RSA 2524]
MKFDPYIAKLYTSASDYYEVDINIDPTSTMNMVRDKLSAKLGEEGYSTENVLFVLGEINDMSLEKCDVLVLSDNYAVDYCRHSYETLNILLKEPYIVKRLVDEWNSSLISNNTDYRMELLELLKPQ